MSDDRMDMKLNFDVQVTDLEKAEILRTEIGKMAEDLARLGRNANASLKNLAGIGKIRLGGTGYRSRSKTGNIDWLPTAARIRTETCLTRAKHAAINALYPHKPPLRGIGVIDPLSEAEKREANKLRMRAARLEQGVTPQSERNRRAEDIALAQAVGCTDRTIRNHRLAGTLDSYLAKRGVSFPKVCNPYVETQSCAQIWEKALTDPQDEGMAMLSDILDDPYFRDEAWADPYSTYQEHASFV